MLEGSVEELLVTEPKPDEPGQHRVTGIRLGTSWVVFIIKYICLNKTTTILFVDQLSKVLKMKNCCWNAVRVLNFAPFQQMGANWSQPALWFLLLVHSWLVPSLWVKPQYLGVALEMPHQVLGSPTRLKRGSDWGWVDWGPEHHPELWRSQSTFPWLCFTPLTLIQLHSASSINKHAARWTHSSDQFYKVCGKI